MFRIFGESRSRVLTLNIKVKHLKEASLNEQISNRSSAYFGDSPKQIEQQNNKFVEQLLRETKGLVVLIQFLKVLCFSFNFSLRLEHF